MFRSISISGLLKYSPENHGYDIVANFSEEDTYIAVIGSSTASTIINKLKEKVHVLYEGPMAINTYHKEHKNPRQRVIIFEKKCQELTPQAVQDALSEEKTPVGTI